MTPYLLIAASALVVAIGATPLIRRVALRFGYTDQPEDIVYKPSVDVFFNSIADNWKGSVIAALLTGMGRDGARGLLAINNAGGYTIAQDEKSSTVFGMPKAAIEIGATENVLDLRDIPAVLLKNTKSYAKVGS